MKNIEEIKNVCPYILNASIIFDGEEQGNIMFQGHDKYSINMQTKIKNTSSLDVERLQDQMLHWVFIGIENILERRRSKMRGNQELRQPVVVNSQKDIIGCKLPIFITPRVQFDFLDTEHSINLKKFMIVHHHSLMHQEIINHVKLTSQIPTVNRIIILFAIQALMEVHSN